MNETSQKNGYKISWDESTHIAKVVVFGETDEAIAKKLIDEATVLCQKKNVTAAMWIIDVTTNTKLSAQARKTFIDYSNRPDVHKLAFIGANPFIRTMINLMLYAVTNRKVKHFASEEECIKWLQSA